MGVSIADMGSRDADSEIADANFTECCRYGYIPPDGALVTQEGALKVINAGATPTVDDK